MNFLTMLADEIQSDFVTTVLPIMRYVLFFLIIACAIVIIITCLLQSNNSEGGDPITGIQESYYTKNKGGSRDGKLKIITIVCASIIAVCVIVYFVTEIVNKAA